MTSAEDIKKNHTLLGVVLEDSENVLISQLQNLVNQYAAVKNLDATYGDIYDRMISVNEELSDIARSAVRIADDTEYDEEAIQNINIRLSQINRLLKKHNVLNTEALLEIETDIQTKLDGFGDLTQEIEKLETSLQLQETELRAIAETLSQARKKVVAGFSSAKVHRMLAMVHLLGMIGTNVLGHQISKNPELKPYHRAVAYTTVGAFTASILVFQFR